MLIVSLPAIQLDFGLTDAQVGLVNAAFVFLHALAVLPAGYLGDRFSRRSVIGIGVGLWSAATLLTGLTQSFGQLLAARAALGIGESTSLPSSISILGDYFAKRDRGRAAGVLGAGLQVGAGLGVIVGGVLAARYGWRFAFFLAVVPGAILAALAFTIREPVRGSVESSGRSIADPSTAGRSGLTRLLRTRSFTFAAIANTFMWFAITGVAGFTAVYVSRRFTVDLASVGALIGPPLVVSALVGNTLGGWLVDRRGRHSPRARLEVPAAACGLGAIGMAVVFTASSPVAFALALTVAATAAQAAIPGLLSVNQNVVAPSLRGRATAIQQLATNLIGRAGGLVAIGIAADSLHDLRLAMLLIAPGALALAAICAAAGLPTLARDTAAVDVPKRDPPGLTARAADGHLVVTDPA